MALTRPALLAVCEGVYPLQATGSLGDSGIRKLRFARRVDAGDGFVRSAVAYGATRKGERP
jgi:hypothetical protein